MDTLELSIMIYQFAWTRSRERELEQAVPLLWHGQHIRRMGWSNEIVLVFLEGLNLLSDNYRKQLLSLGYRLVDGQELANDLVRSSYPELSTMPATWKYWFLRWNVLHILAREQGGNRQVIHLDGDVVLMADPQELERDVAGKTFVLQGCPAFTSITRSDWFDIWESELRLFLQNRPEYIARAMTQKENPPRPSREFCNVCAYTPKWFQDQDLLEFLIATGRLPQARSAEVFDSRFYWIQNPLFPGEWFDEQMGDGLRRVVENEKCAYVGHKQIPFVHFQSSFTQYCYRWLRFQESGCGEIPSPFKVAAEANEMTLLRRTTLRLARTLNLQSGQTRAAVYSRAFQRNRQSGNLQITDIINSCWN